MRARRSGRLRMRLATAVAALLVVAGCSGGGGDAATSGGGATATTSAAGTAAGAGGVEARAASSAFAVEGRDIRLVRVSDKELALQLELFNGTGAAIRPAAAGLDPLGRETLLADLPRGTVYGMLRAGGLDARISGNESIPPGGSSTVTAIFSAPPADTSEMLVMIGALEPVVVPVRAARAPALTDDPVLAGSAPDTPLVSPILSVLETGGGGPATGPLELVLSGDVLFEFGSARLTPAAAAAVILIAEQVDRTSGTLTVEGHTDSVGDDASNQILSEARAAAVRDALQPEMGGGFTYQAAGSGEGRPVAPNQNADGSDNPDGRAQNRRVEIRLTEAGVVEPPLGVRPLDRTLADKGFTVQVDTIQRISGFLLLKATVTNPTADDLVIGVGDGFVGQNDAPDGVTLVDTTTQRRHQMGRWQGVSATEHYAGTFSNEYGATRSGTVPPQATVVFWGLYPSPPATVTAMDVEIGGFGQVVPAQVIAPG